MTLLEAIGLASAITLTAAIGAALVALWVSFIVGLKSRYDWHPAVSNALAFGAPLPLLTATLAMLFYLGGQAALPLPMEPWR